MIYVSDNGKRGIETNSDGEIIRAFGLTNVLVCDAESIIETEELHLTDETNYNWSEFDIVGLRKTMGMTQKEISNYYGIPVRTWQEWEQGRRTPSDYILKMMQRLWIAEKAERVVLNMCNMSKEEFEAVTKLYDYLDMNIESMAEDANNDYLSICTARNGRQVVWYVDDAKNSAMYIDNGQMLDEDEIENELC